MSAFFIAILALVVLLLFTVFALLYVSGLFQSITVYRKRPPQCLTAGTLYAYKIHEGPYEETGYLFTETSNVSQDRLQLGLHFTGLSETDSGERSAVGALLKDEDDKELFENAGFQVTQLPAIEEALVASFPHTSIFSIRLGCIRVYPQLKAYSEEHDLKITALLELYDGEYIHYVGILSDADKFRQMLTTSTDSEKEELNAKDDVETLKSSGFPITSVEDEDAPVADGDKDDEESEDSFEKILTIPETPDSH